MYNYSIPNMTTLVKVIIDNFQGDFNRAVDMTVGNGNDTLFLAKRFKEVIGFDLQKSAIDNTKKLTKDYNNITLYNQDHFLVDIYTKEVDLFVFNLGWLPNSDKSIKTKSTNTINSIKKALSLLNKNGIIIVTCYNGDQDQKNETTNIKNFLANEKNLVTLEMKMPFKENAPLTLVFGRNDL